MAQALYAPAPQAGLFAKRPVLSTFEGALIDLMPSLRAFARSLSRNPTLADDLVQDTSVSALAHESSFVMGSNMRAWLFTILRNQYYTQQRRAWRNIQDVDGRHTEHLQTAPTQNDVLDLQDANRALAKLSTQQRNLLLTVGVTGKAYRTAASESGVAVGTIKSRMSRARRRLAAYMA
jgi:RNA polymerase sigma factor (sigma-70 family)